MFGKRKDKAEITPGDPQFSVRYIGHTDTHAALGRGCTAAAVQRLWDAAPAERDLARRAVLINHIGLWMEDLDTPARAVVHHHIRDIAYCAASHGAHARVFAWVHRAEPARCLQVHAVLCSSPLKAQLMSHAVTQGFQIAYRDWKHEVNKQSRQKTTDCMKGQNDTSSLSHSASGDSEFVCTPTEPPSTQDTDTDFLTANPLLDKAASELHVVEESTLHLPTGGN